MIALLEGERRATGLPVGTLVLASVALHVFTAITSYGFYTADEHFQILEFAYARLGEAPTGDLPWEYGRRMRPTLQPVLAMGVMKAATALGVGDPFLWTLALRTGAFVAGLVTLLLVIAHVGPRLSRDGRRALWLVGLFLWATPYVHVRFMSENLAGVALTLAILLALSSAKRPLARRYLATGALAGAAFFLRFQVAFGLAGLLAWLVWRRTPARHLAALAAGFTVAVGANVALDAWFYGEAVLTPYNYVVANLVEGRAATYGTAPWYGYATFLTLGLVPPLSVALLGLAVFGCVRWRGSAWTWVAVAFLIGHSLVARKDLRFMFPLVYVFPVLVASGWGGLAPRLRRPVRLALVAPLAALNLVLLLFMASPLPHRIIDVDTRFFRALWNEADARSGTTWVLHAGPPPYRIWDDPVHLYRHPRVVSIEVPSGTPPLSALPPGVSPADAFLFVLDENVPVGVAEDELELVWTSFPEAVRPFDVLGFEERLWRRRLYRFREVP